MEEVEKRWTDDMEAHLIDRIKNSPFIWNTKDPRYKSRLTKHKFYSRMTEQIKKKFRVNFTGAEVQKKWYNVKAYYNQVRIKCHNLSADNHNGDEDSYKPYWPHYNSLQFLTSVKGEAYFRKTIKDIPNRRIKTKDFQSPKLKLKRNIISNFNLPIQQQTKTTLKQENNVSETKIPILETKTNNNTIINSNHPNTIEEHYGKYIANQMSILPPKLREITRMKINQALHDVLMKKYENL